MKLARLLGNDHPLFVYNLEQLERATGGAGIDVQLVTEVHDKAIAVMHELGLDPADTTADELYRALYHQAENKALDDCGYVLYEIDNEIVSFNRVDIAENYHHELARGQHTCQHAREHLKLELLKRYAEHERTHESVVRNLLAEINIESEGK